MVLRIFKMISTSGFLTALERTKFVFGRSSAPDPTGEAYSAPPGLLAGLRGPTSKGQWRGGSGKGEGRGRRRRGKRRRKNERDGGPSPLLQIPGSAPVYATFPPMRFKPTFAAVPYNRREPRSEPRKERKGKQCGLV